MLVATGRLEKFSGVIRIDLVPDLGYVPHQVAQREHVDGGLDRRG